MISFAIKSKFEAASKAKSLPKAFLLDAAGLIIELSPL
jgi:hypothetical protein